MNSNHKAPRRSNIYLIAIVITSVGIAGCSDTGDRPDVAKVAGVVTLDGTPLPGASITFNRPGFRSSIGHTDEQGRYELIYIRDIRGAVLGEHEVKIKVFGKRGPRVPAKYNDASELTGIVEAGINQIDFDLKSESSRNS